MAKDKEKVIDEVWNEARIREFLDVQPAAGINADFHRLQKAYQAMRAEDFEEYVKLFKDAGGDINAKDPQGRTLLSYAREHRHSEPFVSILGQNGAE